VSVEFAKAFTGADPEIPILILIDGVDVWLGDAVINAIGFELIGL
jgi:hypothetical protein